MMNRLRITLVSLLFALATQLNANEIKVPDQAQVASIIHPQSKRIIQQYVDNQLFIIELRQDSQDTSGDAHTALQSRILQLQLKSLAKLGEIADLTQQRQLAGENVSNEVSILSPILLSVGPAITAAIEREQKQYRKKIGEANEISAAGLQAYIQYNDKLAIAYQALADISFKLDKLELSDTESMEFLQNGLIGQAETLLGILELGVTKNSELDRMLNITPEDADMLTQKSIVAERSSATIEYLRSTIELLDTIGVDTNSYQQGLISYSGEITTELLNVKVVGSLLSRWWQSIVDFFAENGAEIVFKILLFSAIIFGFRALSNIAKKVVGASLENSNLNLSALMKEMVTSLASRAVMILGVLIALSQLGVSLGPLLAGLGVAGFIIGFALQETLGNFAAGLMILVYRPYDVKDMVEAAGVFGEVKSMSLVSTTILTIDNQTLVIPNNKIWGDVIKNVTAQRVRRVDMVFGIGYSDDIEHAENVLMDILKQHERVLSKPEPIVKLHTLGESSVDFVVRPWVRTDDYWDVYWDITREVKMRFDREGINIPFPQRDVHIYQEKILSADNNG